MLTKKVIPKSNLSKEDSQKVLTEFSILKSMDHPNILRIFELFED